MYSKKKLLAIDKLYQCSKLRALHYIVIYTIINERDKQT